MTCPRPGCNGRLQYDSIEREYVCLACARRWNRKGYLLGHKAGGAEQHVKVERKPRHRYPPRKDEHKLAV